MNNKKFSFHFFSLEQFLNEINKLNSKKIISDYKYDIPYHQK